MNVLTLGEIGTKQNMQKKEIIVYNYLYFFLYISVDME